MENIDVGRRGPAFWPWIIAFVALALVIWALAELLGGEAEVVPEDTPAGVVQGRIA